MLLKFDLDKEVERLEKGYNMSINKEYLQKAFDEYYKNMSPYGNCTINRPNCYSIQPGDISRFMTLSPEHILGFFTLKEDMILDIDWVVDLNREFGITKLTAIQIPDRNVNKDNLFLTGRWLYGEDHAKFIGVYLDYKCGD
jgi:hypothetical protein